MKLITILICLISLSPVIRAEQNSLFDRRYIEVVLKQKAGELFPGDYLSQKIYVYEQLKAYSSVINWRRTSPYQLMLCDVIKRFYPDFQAVTVEYQKQIEVYCRLKERQESILPRSE